MTTPILALQGGSNTAIQEVLLASARRWQEAGLRVVGVVEMPTLNGAEHCLQDLATGDRYEIYQELGPGSGACCLHGAGIVEACENIHRQILEGCDLVVLSKFGKLEAVRSGLVSAFTTAITADKPILTAVAPVFTDAWRQFAGPLSSLAVPDERMIEAWRRTQRTTDVAASLSDACQFNQSPEHN